MADDGALHIRVPMWTPGVQLEPLPSERSIAVLVEPLYLGVAAALALDAGWGSVELAPAGDAAPIPLVSFEQRPTQRGGRCRVRGDVGDLRAAHGESQVELIGSLVHARPLASRLAREPIDIVDFVPIGSAQVTSADAWVACGALIRTVLDESERPCVLDDAAGMAVSLVDDLDGSIATALTTGARWRRHTERGGSEDDLRVASAVDSVAAVPKVVERPAEGTLVVAEW